MRTLRDAASDSMVKLHPSAVVISRTASTESWKTSPYI